ncbi:MAG TPA: TerB family tellurite resistance protein [Candidatus Binatia bacterium]|nr:TerB family tellurite resistance protein [Candidatus Binatia bacterium]
MNSTDVDPRRLVVRLAVAVMTADGRITAAERDVVTALEGIGLGPLSDLIDDEIQRAIRQPPDLVAACDQLADISPEAALVIMAVLCEIAASDRSVTARELATLSSIAAQLGLRADDLEHLLGSAMAAYDAPLVAEPVVPPSDVSGVSGTADVARDPGLERALCVLGLSSNADRARVDAAYLDLVTRYNPTKVIDLGVEFVALAIRKLAMITEAFEYVRDAGSEERA